MLSRFKNDRRNYLFCFGISLLIAFYYGLYFYYFVFSHEYIVQDDVRQHVVWLQRFVYPELFPQDIIAKYFYDLAPIGWKTLYFLAAKVGIEPILLAKLLPPVLSLITTIYIYLFTLEILPIPIAGFFGSLFINQLIWLNDDLVSATARAFIYPLFAAFLYYLSKNKIVPCLILMLLQGLFYPHILLIEMAILSLRLLVFQGKLLINFTKNKQQYIWWLCGLVVTAIALYPITQKPPELTTTVTAVQMQQMPEFYINGRNAFFGGNFYQYWFKDTTGPSLPIFPTIVWCGVLLPLFWKFKLPITKLITGKVAILLQVTVASLLMFFLAHLLLPTLHLPNRYTYHTLRFMLAVSTGIVLTILIDIGKYWIKKRKEFNLLDKLKIALVILFSLAVIIIPAIPYVFAQGFQNWIIGTNNEVYQYLAQQPKDVVVASLSEDANNIPAFSQRSILVGLEFAMAYHPSYYNRIKQRFTDLLEAQYTSNLEILQSFIRQYNIDFILVETNAFTPEYLLQKTWLVNSSLLAEIEDAIAFLESESTPAITKFTASCSVISTEELNLIDTNCMQINLSQDFNQ